jgi:hypothetical protein
MLGRFLQGDPLGFGGGDANLFRYCGGDPVNRRDPTGLWLQPTKQNEAIMPGITVIGSPVSGPSLGGNGLGILGGGGDVSAGAGEGMFLDGHSPSEYFRRTKNTPSTGPNGPAVTVFSGPPPPTFSAPGSFIMPTGGGITVSWWPSWLTFPQMDPVDPETAAWTDKGRVPTLAAAAIIAAPFFAPETGLYAATAAGGYVATTSTAVYNSVEAVTMTGIGGGIVAYQWAISYPGAIQTFGTNLVFGGPDSPEYLAGLAALLHEAFFDGP